MRRVLLALCLVMGLAPAVAGHARADMAWCFDDPVVLVGGHLVDVKVEMPLSNLLTMRSTTLTVVVPSNVSASVVLNDVSVFPMKTAISRTGAAWSGRGSIPITILSTVTATRTYPVQVVATPDLVIGTPLSPSTSVSGWSNSTVRLLMSVGS